MKTTSKAKVIPSGARPIARSVDLVQEKLARSRLLLELEKSQQDLRDNINKIMTPFIRQGGVGIHRVHLSAEYPETITGNDFLWFSLHYQRNVIYYLRIDRCSLEQLASSYYGSTKGVMYSPLRTPTQSELRIAQRLLLSALKTMPLHDIDWDMLYLELMPKEQPVKVAAVWNMFYPDDYPIEPLQFCLTDTLLNSYTIPVKTHTIAENLSQSLDQKLLELPVRLRVEIARQSIPVDTVTNLNVGDVLPLNLHRRCPVLLGNRPLFYGSVHTHDGMLVARLNQDAYQEEELDRG